MHADHAHELGTHTGEGEDGHASEAEAHRGQPSVDLRTRGQRRDAGPSPLEQEFGVIAQPDETRHHAVAIAGNALAEHVTREGDVPAA